MNGGRSAAEEQTGNVVLLRSLVFGSVSGKFRSVVARFTFFQPTFEL